jgi:hypothetical protein
MGRKINQTPNATMPKTTILATKSPQKVEKIQQQIPHMMLIYDYR